MDGEGFFTTTPAYPAIRLEGALQALAELANTPLDRRYIPQSDAGRTNTGAIDPVYLLTQAYLVPAQLEETRG